MEADEELDSAFCPAIVDGCPCGENLTRKANFCPKCRHPVDPLIFKRQKVVVDAPNVNVCNGIDPDGKVCGFELSQKTNFCSNCGTPRASSQSESPVVIGSVSSPRSTETPSSLPVADRPDEQRKLEDGTRSRHPEGLKSIQSNYNNNSVESQSGLPVGTAPEGGSPAPMELSSEEGTVHDDEGKADGKAETSGFDRQTDLGGGHGTADRSPSSRKEGTMRDSSAEGSSDQGKADGKAESSHARQSEIGGGQERFKSEVRMQVRTAATADQKSCSLSQKKDKENAGPTDESDEKSSTPEVVGQQKTSNGDRQSDVQKNNGRCTEHPDGKESSKPVEDSAEIGHKKEAVPNVEESANKNRSESQNVPEKRDHETPGHPLAAESSVDAETQRTPSGNSNAPRKNDSHSTANDRKIIVYDKDGKEIQREVTVLPPKGKRGEGDQDKSWVKVPKQQQMQTRGQTKVGQYQPKVVVRFHVVLPEKDFHFKWKTDVVIMRFMQQELGGWESNQWRMTQEKRIDDEHVLLTCDVEIDKQLLMGSRYLQYKYAILHADLKAKYEFVPKKTYGGGVANRRLVIVDERLRSITEWHQYDGIMIVEPESSILNVYDRWTGRHNEQVMKKTKNAVLAMLPAWKDLTDGLTGYAAGFLDNLDQVCYCVKTCFLNDKVETDESKIKEVLEEYIQPEMQRLTNRLMRLHDESDEEAGLRLASACCLMYVIQNYKLVYDRNTTRPLFYALALRVKAKTSPCPDYVQLTDVFFSTEAWQRQLSGTLLNFIHQMCRRDFVEPLWLFAVPLLHLLDGYVKPFDWPKLGLNHQVPNWWGLQNFSRHVDDFKYYLKDTMPMKEYLEVLGPLFEVDKLLPRTVVAVMSVQHIADLFRSRLVPPEVCLANLYYFATKERDPMVLFPGTEVVEDILRTWVFEFETNNTEMIKSKVDEIRMHHKFAGQFLDVLCREYQYKYEAVNIIATALQMCVNCISNLQKLTDVETAGNAPLDPKDFNVDDKMRILVQLVIRWLNSCSSSSLARESYYSNALHVEEQEIQVCAALLNMKFFDVETGAKWKMQIDEHISQRITKLSRRLRVMVFCHLDFTKYPPEIENCFSREAFKVLENAETVRSGDFSFVFDIADKGDYAQRIRGLLSRILENSWPRGSDGKEVEGDVILQHILRWPSFKRFLNLFYGRSKNIELLSDECKECITVAVSVFDAIIERLLTGSLTVMQLKILLEEKNKEAFLEIFQIMEKNSESGMKNVPESGTKDINKSSVLLKVLTWRQAELRSVGELCEKLENFTIMCGRITSSELDQLRKLLSRNRETLEMNALCKVRTYTPDVATGTYQPEITFFSLTPNKVHMLNELWNLKEGVIFKDSMWNRYANRMADEFHGDGKLDVILSKVWEPAKKLWDSFCQDVGSGELTFKRTDELFGEFNKNYDSIEKELDAACKQRDVVKERLGQIKQYHQLDRYIHGARIIIELRDKFGLSGDFSIPETLADMVEYKTKSLNQITDELVASGRQLEEITDDKVKSLEVFLNHKKFVDWLQNSIKSPKEVKVLVDLAMITAEGQGDMEVQKVKCLHATATGYGPLIYDLKQEMGFREFLPLCQAVWRVLEIDKELPNKFRDTARHLDWLIRIKESHGSVELNALANAQAINAKGIYSVGNLGKGIKSLEDVVVLKLRLEKGERDVGQDSFSEEVERSKWQTLNVQQLKDLQSKLMLVAGKAQEGKEKDVGNFVEILDGITRLGSLYIRICTAGCSLFHHWRAIFDCNPDKPVYVRIEFGRDVQEEGAASKHMLCGWRNQATNGVCGYILDICAFMDACLKEWLDHIEAHRTEFHYLNYYTTEQLVILQNELAKINVDRTQISKDIYPLLSLVKKNCSLKDIDDATYGAFRSLEEKEKRAAQEEEKARMEVVEEEEDEADEMLEQQEAAKKFLEEMESAGFSRKLALRALKNCDPENSGDGIIWCMEHLDLDVGDQEEKEGAEEGEEEKIYDRNGADNRQDRKIQFSGLNLCTTMEALTANLFQAPNLANRLERLSTRLDELWKNYQKEMNLSLADYISTKHLGCMLGHLAKLDDLTIGRTLPDYFKKGKPNLLLCSRAEIFPVVISIYMSSKSQKNVLPGIDEVLVCNAHTTAEDVELLWRRAEGDARNGLHGKIYCLVHAELLDYDIARRVEQSLDRHSHEAKDLQLVVVGCREQEDRSHMINALDRHRVKAPRVELQEVCEYLKHHLTVGATKSGRTAAELDPERCSVRVIQSLRAGVGKSLKVRRLLEQRQEWGLPRHGYDGSFLVSIPLHCRSVDPSVVLARLLRHSLRPEVVVPRIFHIDVAHEVQDGVDYLLFNLLILGSITDRGGYVWSRSPNDLYIIETMPLMQRETKPSVERRNQECQYVHHILQLLPTVTCWSPMDSLSILNGRGDDVARRHKDVTVVISGHDQKMDDKEFRSAMFQRPFQYLVRFDGNQELHGIQSHVPQGNTVQCIQCLLNHCGIRDPSWSELRHFVNFLNVQLRSCEESVFCSDFLAPDLPGFLRFVVQFMMQMSKDFATRSLTISEETPEMASHLLSQENDGDDEFLGGYELKRRWESSPHPYLFFNADRNSFTFMGFIVNPNTGDILEPGTNRILTPRVVQRVLYDALVRNRVNLGENFDALDRAQKIEKMCNILGIKFAPNPDSTYELTADNVKKMLAIYMRFRCDIPVIVMGETGCGKTTLIKFMCDLWKPPGAELKNMILMKVHGGTTAADIGRKVKEAANLAKNNRDDFPDVQTVLFFDEANTTDAIGMIKEIMCDHTIGGEPLPSTHGLKLIAACNPYRKHSDEMIQRLEHAGLGYHIKAHQTADKLGRIPMRHLVYRVQSLPQSMLPLVWDFGQLSTEVETLYIHQMVHRYVVNDPTLSRIPNLEETVSKILAMSQEFMRQQKDECSFVSLRDVDRALRVMMWFYPRGELFEKMNGKAAQEMREAFVGGELAGDDAGNGEDSDEEGRPMYQPPHALTRALVLALGVCYHACLQKRREYRDFIARHFVGPCALERGAIAIEKNINWCQEVFLDEVELGENIARNQALKENLFMMVICIELRIPLFLVGKPGSSKSLAKTIVADAMQGEAARSELFRTLKSVHMVSYQCSPLSTPDGIVGTFRQCAKLQEGQDLGKFVSVVVLDEVGLAEDSDRMPLKTLHPLLEDGCEGDEKPEPHKKVGFIGISNWALDPAKMNRGILVQRGVPDEQELEQSAKGICAKDKVIARRIEVLVQPMAKAYLEMYNSALDIREFFGLRDFYSLIKMVHGFMKRSGRFPSWAELKHAILRNFGGLDNIHPLEVFERYLQNIDKNQRLRDTDPPCDSASLIRCSLSGNDGDSESRYLLILTENYAALSLLQHELLKIRDAIIIFGSSFPKDQEYTQVCRNINRIKVCMETGRTIVLLNLENLYESLYDALNQYYVWFGDERFVDLGLGTQRVKCRVHPAFRLIVVAEKEVVYEKFPIPLINRLEKHFLAMSTMLKEAEMEIAERLKQWAVDFSTVDHYRARSSSQPQPKPGDVFIGYHADTAASLVLQVCHSREVTAPDEILEAAQELLLCCAVPEAIFRLRNGRLAASADKIYKMYFEDQCHGCITDFLKRVVVDDEPRRSVFVQVTTHSRLLLPRDVDLIGEVLGVKKGDVVLEALTAFGTEQQFCRRLKEFFTKTTDGNRVLLLQCDSGDIHADLIACARYNICNEFLQMEVDDDSAGKNLSHVIFIIQLPRIAGGCFVGFQGGKWMSYHIDDLHPPDDKIPPLVNLKGRSLGTLFESATAVKNRAEEELMEEEGANEEEPKAGKEQEEEHQMEEEEEDEKKEGEDEPMDTEVRTDESANDGTEAVALFLKKQARDGARFTREKLESLDVDGIVKKCLHGAMAMLKDSTRGETVKMRKTYRLQLLLKHLEHGAEEGKLNLMTVIRKRLTLLLKDKEETAMSAEMASHWLSNDAASFKAICEAGTFRRALWQYLETGVTPLLAGIVAFADTNANLDILDDSGDEWAVSMWLEMLANADITMLRYKDLQTVMHRSEVKEFEVKMTGAHGSFFQNQLPFSWVIKEQTDRLIYVANQDANRDSRTVAENAFRVSPLGKVLAKAEAEGGKRNVVGRYLADLVRMVHRCHSTNPDAEYKLVIRDIEYALRCSHLQEQGSERSNKEGGVAEPTFLDPSTYLESSFPRIHLAYESIRRRLTIFSELVQLWPESVGRLAAVDTNMPLDLKCLILLMEDWVDRTSAELKGVDTRKTWTNKVRRMAPVVLRLLESVTDVAPEFVHHRDNCRFAWNRIGALQLFVEHVCPSDDADIKQSNRWCSLLWGALGDKTDFKTAKSFDNLEKFFRMCNKMASEAFFGKQQNCPVCNEVVEFPVRLPCNHVLCRKCLVELKVNAFFRCPDEKCMKPFNQNLEAEPVSAQKNGVQKFSRYKQQCNAFFMEVVSLFCFTDNTPPAEEVIRKLMGYVTHRSKWRETHAGDGDAGGSAAVKTKKMFEESLDPTPVVRSFLLQLLLRANIELVRKYLEEYFENARGLFNSDPAQTIELCILCVQCLEDHYRCQSAQCHDETQRIHFACYRLNESTGLLRRGELAVAMETLEEVAMVRFGLNDAALWMHRFYVEKDVGKSLNTEVMRLIGAARAICDQDLLKWPRIYLMRQLARRYGMDSLKRLSESQEWIIPNHARRNENDTIPDRYIVCADDYQRLRELLAEVMIGKDLGPLDDALKNLKCSAEVAEYVALLATYREVTSANVHEDVQRRPTPEIVNMLTEFYNACPTIRNKALSLAIVGNSLDGCLRVLPRRDALDRDVAEIIVQFKILLMNSQNNGLQRPWIDMSTAPQNMQNSFLPTMPQDDLDEVRAVIEKTRTAGENVMFYKCPNGHPYVIGNCGLPGVAYTCYQCGAGVGGTNHTLLPGNIAMGASEDKTRRGHILGQPQKRSPVPERQMSAATTAIMRALLHMSMYLGSLENPQAAGQLIVPPVDPANVSRFIFDHFASDVDTIQNAVGLSRDDVFLFLHILIDFMIRNVQHVDGLDLQLQTKESRTKWESSYVNAYIAQALQGLDAKIQEANNKMVNDDRLGNNPLLRTIFEVDAPAENRNVGKIHEEESLWRFRSHICLEHLAHAFDENLAQKKGGGKDGKKLKTFPILQLFLKQEHQLRAIRLLPDVLRLHRLLLQRLNRCVDSSEATTMKIGEFLDNIRDENQRQDLHVLINSFSEAWNCVRTSLPNHPFGGYTIPLEFTQEPLRLESCLAMLLPSLHGWGLCSVALVYYLQALQNDFLENYSKETKQALQARVDIFDASYAHLVAYHPVHDLQPIILANCNYSLEVGKGTTIEYDFGSMEKQLVERFIRGRPRLGIGGQMAFITYREDFTNAAVFEHLRNRIPQEPLPSPADLERELRHKPTEVTDLRASIDIAVNFLVSVGGDPDMKLAKFMFDTLKMKHTQAMLLSYRLKHVEALWVMLSYLRARMQALYGHEPFEKVDEKYRQPIPDDLLKKLRLGFQHIQMDVFSILLYKCIIFRITVKQNTADEDYVDNSNFSLKDMLIHYTSDSSTEYPIPALEDDRFPGEVKAKHCVATWLCALTFRHQP